MCSLVKQTLILLSDQNQKCSNKHQFWSENVSADVQSLFQTLSSVHVCVRAYALAIIRNRIAQILIMTLLLYTCSAWLYKLY